MRFFVFFRCFSGFLSRSILLPLNALFFRFLYPFARMEFFSFLLHFLNVFRLLCFRSQEFAPLCAEAAIPFFLWFLLYTLHISMLKFAFPDLAAPYLVVLLPRLSCVWLRSGLKRQGRRLFVSRLRPCPALFSGSAISSAALSHRALSLS
jgi:hypothetical protein